VSGGTPSALGDGSGVGDPVDPGAVGDAVGSSLDAGVGVPLLAPVEPPPLGPAGAGAGVDGEDPPPPLDGGGGGGAVGAGVGGAVGRGVGTGVGAGVGGGGGGLTSTVPGVTVVSETVFCPPPCPLVALKS
jgi:hypothetical protein